jgi:hypothetical protein
MVTGCPELTDDGDTATKKTRSFCEITVKETFLVTHSGATGTGQEEAPWANK